MENKETTASEVSQMEERVRGGWMERREGGREGGTGEGKKGRDRSQLVLASLPLFLSLLTVGETIDHGNLHTRAVCGFCCAFL